MIVFQSSCSTLLTSQFLFFSSLAYHFEVERKFIKKPSIILIADLSWIPSKTPVKMDQSAHVIGVCPLYYSLSSITNLLYQLMFATAAYQSTRYAWRRY